MVGGVITNKTPVSLADTTPLLRLTNEYNAIAVPANSPIKTPQDFIAALKADPSALSVGGGSAGGADEENEYRGQDRGGETTPFLPE